MAGDHDHGHDHAAGGNERSLTIALGLTTTFLVVELIGGVLTQSLALISDAAHMSTDTVALGIALAAIRIAKKPADTRRTFSYHRFEILAAAFNAMLLFGVAVYIVYEAYLRLKSPPEIQSGGMLAIAAVGLIANLISVRVKALLLSAPGVIEIHDLHVWALTSGKTSVTSHLVYSAGVDAERTILPFIRAQMAGRSKSRTSPCSANSPPAVRLAARIISANPTNRTTRSTVIATMRVHERRSPYTSPR